MSKYSFIIDNMVWSFSRINSFGLCPYGWKLNYIFGEEQRSGFFGEYGSFCHLVLEKFFKNELETWQLAEFYEKEYANNVIERPPPYPKTLALTYYNRGLNFFRQFEFDKSEWDVKAVEETIQINIDGYNAVIKPDLRLAGKKSGDHVIFDYKTADMSKPGELEKAKLQIHFYALGVSYANPPVEHGVVLQVRNGEQIWFDITPQGIEHAKQWFLEGVRKIADEEAFQRGQPGDYFCKFLCGSRNKCGF